MEVERSASRGRWCDTAFLLRTMVVSDPPVAALCGQAGAEASVTLEQGTGKTQLVFRPPGARCGAWHWTPWWHCAWPIV